MLYLWLKALHVVAIIAWMAGMLYLPRLYVYHAETEKGSVRSETFKIMERRLLTAIMNPAMIATWVLGLYLVVAGRLVARGLDATASFVLVIALSAVHMANARWLKDFAADRNTRPARFYRMWNEVPTLLMIGIVILVIVKPF